MAPPSPLEPCTPRSFPSLRSPVAASESSAPLNPSNIDPIRYFLSSGNPQEASPSIPRPTLKSRRGRPLSRGASDVVQLAGIQAACPPGNPVARELQQLDLEQAWGRSTSDGGLLASASPLLRELQESDYGRSNSVDGMVAPNRKRTELHRQTSPLLEELEQMNGQDNKVDVLSGMKRVQPRQSKQRDFLRHTTSPFREMGADSSDEDEYMSAAEEDDDGSSSSDSSCRSGVLGSAALRQGSRHPALAELERAAFRTADLQQKHVIPKRSSFPRSNLSMDSKLQDESAEEDVRKRELSLARQSSLFVKRTPASPGAVRSAARNTWRSMDVTEGRGTSRNTAVSGKNSSREVADGDVNGDEFSEISPQAPRCVMAPGKNLMARFAAGPMPLPGLCRFMLSPGHGRAAKGCPVPPRSCAANAAVPSSLVRRSTGETVRHNTRKASGDETECFGKQAVPVVAQDVKIGGRLFDSKGKPRKGPLSPFSFLSMIQHSESSLQAASEDGEGRWVEEGFGSPVNVGMGGPRLLHRLESAVCRV